MDVEAGRGGGWFLRDLYLQGGLDLLSYINQKDLEFLIPVFFTGRVEEMDSCSRSGIKVGIFF